MPWRIQLRAKYGKGEQTEFARLFKRLPELGKGVAVVPQDTEIVLTFLAESQGDLEKVTRLGSEFEKQGLKIDIKVTKLEEKAAGFDPEIDSP